MYRRLAAVCAPLLGPTPRVLSISHSRALCEAVGLTGVEEANWPEHDVRSLAFADDTFDWVVADQVLEHVEGDPFDAFGELVRVARRGGIVLVASPTVYPRHLVPEDYWRFTSDGLRVMAEGTDVIEVGGWGNRAVWVMDLLGLRRLPVPRMRMHPLRRLAEWNEPNWPAVSWIVARKT